MKFPNIEKEKRRKKIKQNLAIAFNNSSSFNEFILESSFIDATYFDILPFKIYYYLVNYFHNVIFIGNIIIVVSIITSLFATGMSIKNLVFSTMALSFCICILYTEIVSNWKNEFMAFLASYKNEVKGNLK